MSPPIRDFRRGRVEWTLVIADRELISIWSLGLDEIEARRIFDLESTSTRAGVVRDLRNPVGELILRRGDVADEELLALIEAIS